MVSVNDPDGGRTAALITNYSVLLSLLPLIAVWENLTSSMFLVEVSRALRITLKGFSSRWSDDDDIALLFA